MNLFAKALWIALFDYMVLMSLPYLILMRISLLNLGKSFGEPWVLSCYSILHFTFGLKASLNKLARPFWTCYALSVL